LNQLQVQIDAQFIKMPSLHWFSFKHVTAGDEMSIKLAHK